MTIGLAMYAVLELTRHYPASYGSIYVVLFCGIEVLAVFGIALLLWPRAREEALGVFRLVKMLKGRSYRSNGESN
jgi:hypothetical protein